MVMRGAHLIKDKHLSVFFLIPHNFVAPRIINNNEDISLSIFQ